MSAPAFYLGEVVHRSEDENGLVEVVDEARGKLRSLHFGSSARQSTMFVERPDELALEYTRHMLTALPLLEGDPRRALMLGLGGGSLVKFLLRQCPQCHVDVVELRAMIVEVAQRFFGVPEAHERLAIHVADGRRYVLDYATAGPAATPYDLILVDLHGSHGMAPVVTEPDFLPACRQVMAADGVLSANLWFGVDEAQERRLRKHLAAIYEQVLYLPVAGKRNCIAHGLSRSGLPARADMEHRAQDWLERADLPLPGLLDDLARHNRWPRPDSQ